MADIKESETFSLWMWLKHQCIAVIVGPLVIVFHCNPAKGGIRYNSRAQSSGRSYNPRLLRHKRLFFSQSASTARTAMWSWVIPSIGLLILFLNETRDLGREAAIQAFFTWQVTDDESLLTGFVTFPTACSVVYSLGAFVKRLQARHI
jgi:hypothetical protein